MLSIMMYVRIHENCKIIVRLPSLFLSYSIFFIKILCVLVWKYLLTIQIYENDIQANFGIQYILLTWNVIICLSVCEHDAKSKPIVSVYYRYKFRCQETRLWYVNATWRLSSRHAFNANYSEMFPDVASSFTHSWKCHFNNAVYEH